MNKKGFTLVELLVVIAIIGILASIAFVSLSSTQDTAKQRATQLEIRQIVSFAVDYSLKNDNSYSDICDTSGNDYEENEVSAVLGDAINKLDLSDTLQKDDLDHPKNICESTSSTFIMAKTYLDGIFWCVDESGAVKELDYTAESGAISELSTSSDSCSDLKP